LLGIVVGLIVAVVRAMREAGGQQPELASRAADRFAAPSSSARTVDGHVTAPAEPQPTDTSPPHGDPVAPHKEQSEPVSAKAHREPTDTSPPHGDPVAPRDDVASPETSNASPTWKEPTADGGCPKGYPIKANASSRIYHVPGGLSYDRTQPERCYATAEAAEADGFRAAKR
jgi:hypothetical protein